MSRIKALVAGCGMLALTACAVAPPEGPSVAAMPAAGKTLPQFQQDDVACRSYASQQNGYASPQQAANNAAVGSAVVGTGLGAAAGALLGAAAGNPGVGAAIGAGSGLLMGSAVGANNAYASAGAIQQRYDTSYMQCMSARGESVPQVASSYPGGSYGYPGYPAAYPAYPYYPYPYPYYGYGPVVGFSFGYGHGWHHWR